MIEELKLKKYETVLENIIVTNDIGKVKQVTGFLIRGFVPGACIGSICRVHSSFGRDSFLAEVVGFEDRNVLLMPLEDMVGIGHGAKIVLGQTKATVSAGEALVGRVLNGLGEPIDGKGLVDTDEEIPLYRTGSNPLNRPPIRQPLDLGVRAIDGLITVGRGQRMGIMAGSGVGKSVLMGMIARSTKADINVIALIGERGREVREFIEDNLGEEGLRKSVVVAVTSDQSPLLRMRGAFLATSLAEYFCDKGRDVLLMMDSVTRFAMAQREIGLSVGEPPASKGYTPSVFSTLPKLLERAGTFDGRGSITGLYTVLVEGDDMDEPIADAVRSIVDGHIVLDRKIAQRNHFPAIDVLQSTSRVMRNVTSEAHRKKAGLIRELMASYREAEDLINIGAYKEGSNQKIDQAIQLNDYINQMLRQEIEESSTIDQVNHAMAQILGNGE